MGGELKLSDYQNIWTKFCFLDESGTLGDMAIPFFTIGFIKCSEPYYILSRLAYERDRTHFYDELKFNKISARNLNFAKFAVDTFFSTRSVGFHSYTLDKDGTYFKKRYGGDPWQAYEDISLTVLKSSIPKNEILIVIADHVQTPKHIKFELNIKNKINNELGRLAVAGVCRFNSKSNDLLQLTDLLIGCITYDLKLSTKIVTESSENKIALVEHLKKQIGVSDFLHGYRDRNFNIFVDKDILSRLSTKEKELPT